MSATSSKMPATYSGTLSTWRYVSKPSQSPAVFVFLMMLTDTSEINSISPVTMAANKD